MLCEVRIAHVENDGILPPRHAARSDLSGVLLEQRERQIVYSRVADVLERVSDEGLPGAGQSRGDDKARLGSRHRALSRAESLRRFRRATVKRSDADFRAISSCTFAAISRAALNPRRLRRWVRSEEGRV